MLEQAANVCETTVVRDAWARGQPLTVHGWIYGLHDGLLRDLGFAADDPGKAESALGAAVRSLSA
ncbi:Carbonic anhydrase 2 [compost metagenome]